MPSGESRLSPQSGGKNPTLAIHTHCSVSGDHVRSSNEVCFSARWYKQKPYTILNFHLCIYSPQETQRGLSELLEIHLTWHEGHHTPLCSGLECPKVSAKMKDLNKSQNLRTQYPNCLGYNLLRGE